MHHFNAGLAGQKLLENESDYFSFTPAYPAEQVTFRAYLDNSDIESVIFENVA
jgi:hypothetical protein